MDNAHKIREIIFRFYPKQEDFAETMGATKQAVSNWCKRGVSNIETLKEIVDKTPGLNPLYFFYDDAPIRVDEVHKNVNSTEERLLSLLEEKDRQINRLLSILEQKK